MIFEYINSDNTREIVPLNKEVNISNRWQTIDAKNKREFVEIFYAYYKANQRTVLFDTSHKQLLEFYKSNSIDSFDGIETVNKVAQMLFFTSGSTGFPLGAFKSISNLLEEVKVIARLLANKKIKKVVVTVPFVHIYGVLVGLLLPLYLDKIILVIKEEFLPYELIDEGYNQETLFITTPVFIKALLHVKEAKRMCGSIFISSTAPLMDYEVENFQKKFNTSLVQLFGSTETGGVAYKKGFTHLWTPLEGVEISLKKEKLNISSPYLSEFIIDKKVKKLKRIFQTEDIVELYGDKFKLLGRSGRIVKISGKRVSCAQIESIIEQLDGVKNAIVSLNYKENSFKNEHILISLEVTKKIIKKDIQTAIYKNFGLLSTPFSLKIVDKISRSSTGKKILFPQ